MLWKGTYRYQGWACTNPAIYSISNIIRRRNCVCVKKTERGVVRLTTDRGFKSTVILSIRKLVCWYRRWYCSCTNTCHTPSMAIISSCSHSFSLCPLTSASYLVQSFWPKGTTSSWRDVFPADFSVSIPRGLCFCGLPIHGRRLDAAPRWLY